MWACFELEVEKDAGDVMDSVVSAQYCLLTVSPIDIHSVVLTPSPIHSESINVVPETGKTLVDVGLLADWLDISDARVEVTAALLRSRANPETGSSFTTGTIQKLDIQLQGETKRREQAELKLKEAEEKLKEAHLLISAAGKRQKGLVSGSGIRAHK